MQAFMAEEGYSFYYTPIHIWTSYTLRKIHKNGGKPVLLSEYDQKQEQATNDLLARLETIQNANKTYEF